VRLATPTLNTDDDDGLSVQLPFGLQSVRKKGEQRREERRRERR